MMENTSQTPANIEKIPLTCIICPMGCSMEVEVETDAGGHKKVLSVKDQVRKYYIRRKRNLFIQFGKWN